MSDTCYRCGTHRAPALQRLCPTCEVDVHNKAYAIPTSRACLHCGYLFVTDWERVKHELVGTHTYRSWTAMQAARGNDA